MGEFLNHLTESTSRDPQTTLAPVPSRKTICRMWVCLQFFFVLTSPDVPLFIMSKAFWDILGGNQTIKIVCLFSFIVHLRWKSAERTTTFSTDCCVKPRCSTPSTAPKSFCTTDTSVDLSRIFGADSHR